MSDPSGEERLAGLMRAAQEGDSDAYQALMQELARLVRGVVRRRRAFLAVEDVEDLVQEVLLSVHSVRGTYNPGRPFLPWLLAIAHNRMVDAARRYSRGA